MCAWIENIKEATQGTTQHPFQTKKQLRYYGEVGRTDKKPLLMMKKYPDDVTQRITEVALNEKSRCIDEANHIKLILLIGYLYT